MNEFLGNPEQPVSTGQMGIRALEICNLNSFDHRRNVSAGVGLIFIEGAAALSALLGVIVLIGWAIDAPILRSVIPGAVQMKANTAVALVAAGVVLRLATRPRSQGHRALAQILAIFIAMLRLATLAEYQFRWNLRIDELLVRDTASAFNSDKGRMSPYSAVAFVALLKERAKAQFPGA